MDPVPFAGRNDDLKTLKEITSAPGFSMIRGRRGAGRTSLLRKFAEQFNSNRQYKLFYADVSDAVSPATFIISIARQLLSVPEAGQMKQLRELANYFTYLRPVINFNKASGNQQLDFTLDENFKADFTLEQLFGWLSRQSAKTIVILDDLQQVMDFRDQSFIGFIPQVIKQNAELRILGSFAESKRFSIWIHEKENLFKSKFQQHVISYPLHEEFRNSLTEWFKLQGKKVSNDAADHIIDWCRSQTSLVVKLSQMIAVADFKQPDDWQLEKIFSEFLNANKNIYQTYRRLLTVNQWLLMRGIAREKGAKLVMSGDFVRKYGLGSPSSVQTALDALYDKELIYEEEGNLYLEDVGLSRWLEEN